MIIKMTVNRIMHIKRGSVQIWLSPTASWSFTNNFGWWKLGEDVNNMLSSQPQSFTQANTLISPSTSHLTDISTSKGPLWVSSPAQWSQVGTKWVCIYPLHHHVQHRSPSTTPEYYDMYGAKYIDLLSGSRSPHMSVFYSLEGTEFIQKVNHLLQRDTSEIGLRQHSWHCLYSREGSTMAWSVWVVLRVSREELVQGQQCVRSLLFSQTTQVSLN